MQGRIEGRKSADGASYEIKQGGTVLRTIPIAEAMTDQKLSRVIKQNKWEPLA